MAERVEPPRECADRSVHDAGVPVGGESVETLVWFGLSEVDSGTRLRLLGSGFADDEHRRANTEGRTTELADLVALARVG